MDHDDALQWLYGRQVLGVKLGLDKVHRLLAAIGDPQKAYRSIHIAGTNGKGSVALWLDGALRNAGCKVGCFTSPHLVRFSERITVDGAEIPDDDVARLVDGLRPITETLDQEEEPPTFFELVTAMAMQWFQEHGVDWAVFETGMGGRLDATNVIDPDLCIITNVGMDHQAFLGDHILDIANEKAGIMKAGIPCVTGAVGDARIALKTVSQQKECPMSILDEDYQFVPDVGGFSLVHPGGTAHYAVDAPGEHQLRNAAIAVAACDALRERGVDLPVQAVQKSLAETILPGRLETIRIEGVQVLLDGAHNLDGAVALRRHLAHLDTAGFQLITGFNADKPWQGLLAQWAPLAARVIGVPLRSGRTLDPEAMRSEVEGIGIPFVSCECVEDALRLARDAGPDMVLVAGSMFLVGEARAVIEGEPLEEIRGDQ